MMVSQKDQAVLVEMMANLYLRVVSPRPAREVSLEEFMAFLRCEIEPGGREAYLKAVEYQVRFKAVVDKMARQLEQSVELMKCILELKEWVHGLPKENEEDGDAPEDGG